MFISLLCVIFVNFYNLYVHVYLETICVIAKFAIIYSLFGSNIYIKWQHHIYWRYLSTIQGFVYFFHHHHHYHHQHRHHHRHQPTWAAILFIACRYATDCLWKYVRLFMSILNAKRLSTEIRWVFLCPKIPE